jgi:anti-sigma-K factor RskA
MNTFSRITLAAALLATPACKTVNYRVAAGAPTYAADAQIQVKPNKTGNGDVTVKMVHLAPPKRIDKALAGYVAWVEVKDQAPVKLGILEYSEKKRVGLLHATTPQKAFTLKVTMEKSTNVQAPTGTVIISHAVKTKL